MSAAPFDVGPVIERLHSRLVSADGFRLVGTGADYASVRSLGDFPAPCAYVLLASENAIETKTGISQAGKQHQLAQVVQVGLGVAMAFRNFRGMQGSELRDELRDRIGAVRNQLLGWTPPVAGGRQLQLTQGDLREYDDSVALWVDFYQTQHVIQPEITP